MAKLWCLLAIEKLAWVSQVFSSLRFLDQNPVYVSPLAHPRYMQCSSMWGSVRSVKYTGSYVQQLRLALHNTKGLRFLVGARLQTSFNVSST